VCVNKYTPVFPSVTDDIAVDDEMDMTSDDVVTDDNAGSI
jgi:hypothetical protein